MLLYSVLHKTISKKKYYYVLATFLLLYDIIYTTQVEASAVHEMRKKKLKIPELSFVLLLFFPNRKQASEKLLTFDVRCRRRRRFSKVSTEFIILRSFAFRREKNREASHLSCRCCKSEKEKFSSLCGNWCLFFKQKANLFFISYATKGNKSWLQRKTDGKCVIWYSENLYLVIKS